MPAIVLKIRCMKDIYTSGAPQYPLTETINDATYEQPEKYGDISIRFLCGVKMADISGVTRKIGK